MGKDGNLLMRNLNNAFKVAAADGAVRMAGLLDDSEIQSDGTSKMKLQTNVEETKESRDYFSERLNVNKTTDVDDVFSSQTNAAGEKEFVNDTTSRELFKKIFKTLTPQTRFTGAMQSSLEKLRADLGAEWTSLLDELGKINANAAQSLRERIGD